MMNPTETDALTEPGRAALAGLTVLQRGWLSSNNIVIHAAGGNEGEPGAVLVDASHVTHAEQTVALVRHALQGKPLARIVNTHLHSDHCGGNAALQREFGAPIFVPPGLAQAVHDWDAAALTHETTGQRCERFAAAGTVSPGETFVAGARHWQVLAAPGHDPHSVILFDSTHGVLLSADALWEHGFGVVFPEIAGEPGFDDVAATLDLIESLPVQVVVPGHGAPFCDVAAALATARSRLAAFRADPQRHARHAAKVLIKYHLMEERSMPVEALRQWLNATPTLMQLWQRFGARQSASSMEWCEGFLQELVRAGALDLRSGVVHDA